MEDNKDGKESQEINRYKVIKKEVLLKMGKKVKTKKVKTKRKVAHEEEENEYIKKIKKTEDGHEEDTWEERKDTEQEADDHERDTVEDRKESKDKEKITDGTEDNEDSK